MPPERTQSVASRVSRALSHASVVRLARNRRDAGLPQHSFRQTNQDAPSSSRPLSPWRVVLSGTATNARGALRLNPEAGHIRASADCQFADVVAGDDGKGVMMKRLQDFGSFIRNFSMRARFGELSRAPLCLLRLQLCGDAAECDWLARPPDVWDGGLAPTVGERNASQQALKDAIAVRDLLFSSLPDLKTAAFRVYRRSPGDEPELIIAGAVSREERAPVTVRSLAMRAKLLGFRFWMDDGILETLQADG